MGSLGLIDWQMFLCCGFKLVIFILEVGLLDVEWLLDLN